MKTYFTDILEKGENGLYLCQMPTGSGKTYSVVEAIKDYVIGHSEDNSVYSTKGTQEGDHRDNSPRRKIIYLTTLNKNVIDTELQEAFGDEGLYSKNVLHIRANLDEVIEKLPTMDIPSSFRNEQYFNLKDSIGRYCEQEKRKSEGKKVDDVYLDILRKEAFEAERAFRGSLGKELNRRFKQDKDDKKGAQLKEKKLEAIRYKKEYRWIGELYPAVFTDDHQVLLMSVSKFIMKNSTIVERSNPFLEADFIKDAVIFIDEFDSTKEMILHSLIQSALRLNQEYISLFRLIANGLSYDTMPFQIRRACLKAGRSEHEALVEKAEEIIERHHVDRCFKTDRESVSRRMNFLFKDSAYHTFASDKREYVRTVFDKNENRSVIYIETKEDYDRHIKEHNERKSEYEEYLESGKPSDSPKKDPGELVFMYVMLREIDVFIMRFNVFLSKWAEAYADIINAERHPTQVKMTADNAKSSILHHMSIKKKYVAKYVFDKDTKVFRRKLKTDTGYTDDEIFCLAGFEGKRMSVKYINFTSLGSFKRSKAGVICRFLDDVREYLGEYFTLEQCIRDNDEVFCEKDKPKADLEDKAYGRILNEKGVNIVDECGIPLSQTAVKRIHSDLLDCFGVEATIGPIRESAYNIRIIYDREYYEDKKLKDEYISYTPGTVTQHITLPNAEAITAGEKRPDPIVRKLVMELVLKGDIEFGKVRVYDWKSISAGKEWSFVHGKKIKGKKIFRYYMVKISTGGKLSFSFFSDDDLLLPDLEEKIRTVYLRYEERLRKHDKKYVEGLLFSDPDHIHIISRTCMNTMPDIVKIRDAFVQTNPKEVLDKDKVKKALKQYGTLFPEDAEYVGEVYEAVETHSELLTKYDLKTIINVKKKAGKRLIRFLHEEHGIWIYHELKDSAFKDLYRLDNMTDIRYFIDEKTAGEDIRSFNYYAGIRSNDLNQSLRNACVVREVRTDDGDLEFEELLPLMAVDFVRIAQYTVLPFPFKYLREYAKMCESVKVQSE